MINVLSEDGQLMCWHHRAALASADRTGCPIDYCAVRSNRSRIHLMELSDICLDARCRSSAAMLSYVARETGPSLVKPTESYKSR